MYTIKGSPDELMASLTHIKISNKINYYSNTVNILYSAAIPIWQISWIKEIGGLTGYVYTMLIIKYNIGTGNLWQIKWWQINKYSLYIVCEHL